MATFSSVRSPAERSRRSPTASIWQWAIWSALVEGETVPQPPPAALFGLNIPGLLAAVDLHDRVVFDDGKLNGVVVEKSQGIIRVQIAQAQAQSVSLKDKKGVSFPDSTLPVRFLTQADIQALDAVIDLADLIAFRLFAVPPRFVKP